ncbi:MAG: hypothetical protein AB7S70_01105 [Hyphomicrobium sp.]|uniref:hypothetical protein n=1 Tax=Hyphomicrobium sp. TaxID=82 RepID=UPI003D0A3B2E
MTTRIIATAALGTLALFVAPLDADAGRKKPVERDRLVERDCTPVNGPFGYYGNPWCDGGYKYAEDWDPGTGGYLDVFDLPQVQRLRRRFE